ncbi:MAG: hypothetical protein OXG10_03715 [Candidatus Dadabacteria bacterium]|nr:hypothetical protein [Candidatus Dadabacteria bacterium]
MRKILVLSFLFALLAVPVSAITDAERKELWKKDAFALQSFGWECNEIVDVDGIINEHARNETPWIINRITCKNGLVYFKKVFAFDQENLSWPKLLVEYCYKGKCKKHK